MSKYDLYLNLIGETIGRVEKDMNKSLEDDTVWDAMLMRFQIIGENIDKLPKFIREKHREINWVNFYDFRNTISHEYNKVLMEVVVNLINEIPELKKSLGKIRGELKNE